VGRSRLNIEGPKTRESEATGRVWGFVLAVFAGSRLFYLLAGALLAPVHSVSPLERETSVFSFGALSIWANFDGEHYVNVAEGGYAKGSPAFFPLYPLLMRLAAVLFGGPVSPGALSVYGVLISLVAFLFALYFVYRIAEDGWGLRAAQGAVLALAFFPTSFFFNAVYTESLFLALSAGAIWAASVRKDFLLACLLAGLATATRSVGVLLLFPLVAEWSERPREYGWRAAYLILVPTGLVAYMAYLWWRFGDPLLFYGEQAEWGREPAGASGFVNAFRLAYEDALLLFNPANYEPFDFGRLIYVLSATNHLYSLLFLLFALTVLVAGWRLLPVDLWAYALAILAVPILFASVTSPLMSAPRFVLAAFPLFIVLGATVLENRKVLLGWLLASATASLAFTTLFVGWYFVA
jgi:Gpi18-like mannosyltransferase